MARDSGAGLATFRGPPRMLCPLAVDGAAVGAEVAFEIAPLHAAKVRWIDSRSASAGTSSGREACSSK
jgi:hypothetical protein